jgi:hypothetical protein
MTGAKPARCYSLLFGRALPGAASTQHFPHVADCEYRQKRRDARTSLKPSPLVFTEPGYFIDRQLRFPGQSLDGSLLMGWLAALGVHGEITLMGLGRLSS